MGCARAAETYEPSNKALNPKPSTLNPKPNRTRSPKNARYQNGFLSIREPDSAGWPPLCYAALDGSPMLLASLLEQRADVNSSSTKYDKLFNFPSRIRNGVLVLSDFFGEP